ncbi:hypothetical protein CHS0354_005828 [Potamilus streckersoni]|uniref:Uncharacterized protein n=1 Tax=Potamilus streckersoni TaxID=2493646 RepID=A0AAE0RQB9_9BIVA|nr:hypothetical protein CHS0354_005828 [Potamilus streckersoni]
MEPHENTWTFMLLLFLRLLSAETINSQVHIIGICDDNKDLGFNSSAVFQSVLLVSQGTPRLRFEWTVIQGSRSLMENLNALDHGIQLYGSYFLISFGSDAVVQASAVAAHSFGIPVITYPTSPTARLIYQENIIDLRPTLARLANEVYTLIGQRMIHKVYVICQDSLINDGFVEIFTQISQEDGFNESQVVTIPTIEQNTKLLRRALLKVSNSGNRLFVLHCTGDIFGTVMRMADAVGLFDVGHAWIVTPTALTVDLDTLDHVPPGVLAVKTYENDNYTDILKSTVDLIQQTIERIILDKNGKEAEEAIQSFLRAGNFSAMRKNNSLFDEKGSRLNVTYQLLNLVTSVSSGLTWNPIDYIRGDALDIDTIIWPGQHILGPVRRERGQVTVVTKESEPFVFITGPVESRYFCPGDIPCIELYTDDPKIIGFIVNRFKDGIDKMEGYYRTFCCEGLVMDILQKISKELKFDFVVFFKNDSSYGNLVNGTWTGMVGNVLSGTADIIAGALSMNSSKMNAISFTHSFYHSGFDMISLTSGKHISVTAFLCPFNIWEWLCIFATASITAVATALLEWNSPFGLNPWSRRMGSNYSLGSGIFMVYSLWFRHAVNIKYPKSWPSKIVQNCWAWVAIFLIARYTANLAAVMAGNSDQEEMYSILDSRLHEKRIAVVPNSAAEVFTKTINSGLGVKLQRHYVHSVHEAFRKLRDGEIDLFLDDHTMLEYHMHSEDTDCSLKYAGYLFGDESYAFGVRKDSWLKEQISALVLKYVKSGMIDELKWRYLRNKRRCVNNLQSAKVWKKFGLKHTEGLFIMLLVAVGVAVILLCFEHLVYIRLVPKVRIKPRNSFWKSKRIAFVSQRLYRSIVSEEFVSARETAIEMMDMVKRRHCIRLFQKDELLEKRNEINLIKHKKQGIGDIAGNLVALKRQLTKPQEISDTTSNGPFTISSGDYTSESFHSLEHYRNQELPNVTDTNFSSSGAKKPLDMLLNSKYHHDLGHINPAVSEEDDMDNSSVGHHRYDVTMKNSRSSDVEIDSTDSYAIRYTEETRRKSQAGWVFDKWPTQIPDGSIILTPVPRMSQSFTFMDQISSSNQIVNTGSVRSMSSSFYHLTHADDYFSRNIELKDNRVKSTIRRHTMTGFHLSSSAALDKCAVEALSKADILVLWKQSEIELKTRLYQIEAQNRYMLHIIKLRQLSNRDKENRTEQKERARKF